MNTAASVRMRAIDFRYGESRVLRGFDLDLAAGSLFALLGPSGSGKSTVLSLLAGLLRPDSGTIHLDAEEVTHTSPQERRVGVVFQSYALFPHLTVEDNIGFAPRQQRLPHDEISARVRELAARLAIDDLLGRRPAELSGGQQQRVALARALAMRPRVLLLDEPMSNVDPALRTHLRGELRAWLERWQVTTLLVTHDREDALWLADEIGLLRDGSLLQRGRPSDVYRRPLDLAAARLLGPAEPAPVARVGEDALDWNSASPTHLAVVRPEDLRFHPDETGSTRAGTVVDLGGEARVAVQLGTARVWTHAVAPVREGQTGRIETVRFPWLVPLP